MKQSYTSQEKKAIQEQIDIHTSRLNNVGDLEKVGIEKLIADHKKQLEKPTEDLLALGSALQSQIESLEKRLETEEDELVIDGIKTHIDDLRSKLSGEPVKKKKGLFNR